jgi:hypothetical protein
MVVMGNADTGLRLVKEVIFLLSQFIAQLVERLEYEKKIAEFNAYFTCHYPHTPKGCDMISITTEAAQSWGNLWLRDGGNLRVWGAWPELPMVP